MYSLKKFFFILISSSALIYLHKTNYITNANKSINNYYLNELLKFGLYFNVSYQYLFSIKFYSVEVKYFVNFYNISNNDLIIPSDLALNYNIHLICIIYKNSSINIYSLPTIEKNKFECIEYFNPNEKIKIGLKIYNEQTKNITSIFLYENINFHFKNFDLINDDIFDYKTIFKDYLSLYKNITNETNIIEKNFSLIRSYISAPYSSFKEIIDMPKNTWNFLNLYNNYFCYYVGERCEYKNIDQVCKYKLYLNIIDKNKNLYNKTHYLLADFLIRNIAPGDAYFLFKGMKMKNIPAYYLTVRSDLYDENYNANLDKNHQSVILEKKINGDFLEKYLNLFLKLKVVISGAEFYYIDNLFYNIDYITFICLGHGVNYFKPFLYTEYYGPRRYNKIILASNFIIKIAKEYGWKDEDIIKVGQPKWDIFDNNNLEINPFRNRNNNINKKSIFVMFTWRELKKKKHISSMYFNNILKLLNNRDLNDVLTRKGIVLYLSLHHNLIKKRKLIKPNKNLVYIKQEEILYYLYKSNLIISDFSSVIFDFIYQNKPYIIFLPDTEDPLLNELYTRDYFDVINGMKNNSIFFKNKFFNIKDTVNKIIYYINNNFEIEKELKEFYNELDLGFKKKNHISEIIKYIINF